MNINFELPIEVNSSEQELSIMAKEFLLCSLYVQDKVTEMQATTMLNLTRREFNAMLQKYNIPRLHTEEDLEHELNFI